MEGQKNRKKSKYVQKSGKDEAKRSKSRDVQAAERDRESGNDREAAKVRKAGKYQEPKQWESGNEPGKKSGNGNGMSSGQKPAWGQGRINDRNSGGGKQNKAENSCPYAKKCGGCDYQGVAYEKQLEQKQEFIRKNVGEFCKVRPIIGMEHPYHYRNKVHAVFDIAKGGTIISGVYKAGTHDVVNIDECRIEDQKADAIIRDIRGLLRSFKIKTYDEDTGYGLLRHVLIRRGFHSGEIMVVLVLGSPILPSKNNFVKALRKLHPEITTIIVNVNNKRTSMVLGDKETTIYGKGYIEDTLCGCTFRISSKSFYQVNPFQTEILYSKAIEYAGLTGKETVVDAYCGIGTIGLIAASGAKEVISVELNRDAVRDAVMNAKRNHISNVQFYQSDAGEFMSEMAGQLSMQGKNSGSGVDVVFMDPPRAGSDEAFLSSVVKLAPKRVVYISCNPETLARDLRYMRKCGYEAVECQGVDMFPWTKHVEVVIMMTYCGSDKKNRG